MAQGINLCVRRKVGFVVVGNNADFGYRSGLGVAAIDSENSYEHEAEHRK